MEQFYTLLTNIGKAKIANATALQSKVKFTKILVGDGNGDYYEPMENQTKLKNKVWEGGIGNISIDKENPNWIVLESVIPSNIGGFTIREIGIEDEEGDLVVIAKYPQTYKPKIQDGSTKDLIIKTILEVTNVDTITLKVDPTIVLTTKKDLIDSQKELENKIDKNFIKKKNNTTWQDLNVNGDLETGDTPMVKLNRPNVTDKVLLEPLNSNFTKIDDAIKRLGYNDLVTLSRIRLSGIKTGGIYLIKDLENAPDIPPKDKRLYLVKSYVIDSSTQDIYYEVYSIGTGKRYSFDTMSRIYSDIPCTSSLQPDNLYIDSVTGNDDNDGDKENPVRTWECAYSRIPKILTKGINISFVNIPTNSDIYLSNLSSINKDTSMTWLLIHGNNCEVNQLHICNCNFGAFSYGISLKELNVSSTLSLTESSTTNITNSKIRNVNVSNSVARCSDSTVSQYEAEDRAFIQLNGHKQHGIKATFGCFSTHGSLIYVSGEHPTGDGGEKHEAFGGRVEYEG